MNVGTTLCFACKRPGSNTCSWDKEFIPVDGWEAIPTSCLRIKGGSYLVKRCPLFVKDRDPDGAYNRGESLEDVDRSKGKSGIVPDVAAHYYYLGCDDTAVAKWFGSSREAARYYRKKYEKAGTLMPR